MYSGSAEEGSTRDRQLSAVTAGLGRRWRSLTSLGRVGHVLVDGTEVVLLLAQLPGPENVTDALVEVRILALRTEVEERQS